MLHWCAELRRRAAGKLDYAGMTCVVDASRYPTLKQVVNAVNEQVAYADSFVIAKADLVDEKTLAGIREDLP
ncbi:hypothetical protein MASR2M78_34760 [Treponema sp.]